MVQADFLHHITNKLNNNLNEVNTKMKIRFTEQM